MIHKTKHFMPWFLMHRSRRLKFTIVITPCPSSVVFRPYIPETAEQNSTKLDRKQDLNTLYKLCVSLHAPASDWLTPLKPLNRYKRNLTRSKNSTSSAKFLFFGPFGQQDDRLGLWLAELFAISILKQLKEIQRNLTERKISASSTMFVFFGPIVGSCRFSNWPS